MGREEEVSVPLSVGDGSLVSAVVLVEVRRKDRLRAWSVMEVRVEFEMEVGV